MIILSCLSALPCADNVYKEFAIVTYYILVIIPGMAFVEVHELAVMVHHTSQAPLVPDHPPPHLSKQSIRLCINKLGKVKGTV